MTVSPGVIETGAGLIANAAGGGFGVTVGVGTVVDFVVDIVAGPGAVVEAGVIEVVVDPGKVDEAGVGVIGGSLLVFEEEQAGSKIIATNKKMAENRTKFFIFTPLRYKFFKKPGDKVYPPCLS